MMTMTRKQLRDVLDTEEFYDLMQAYRHADVADQSKVCDCYEEVKTYVLSQHAALVEQRDQLVEALRLARKMFDYIAELSRIEQAQIQAQQGTRMINDFFAMTTIEQERAPSLHCADCKAEIDPESDHRIPADESTTGKEVWICEVCAIG